MLKLPTCPLCDHKFRMAECFSSGDERPCPSCSKSLTETKGAKKASKIFGAILGLYIGAAAVLAWQLGVGATGLLLLALPIAVIIALIFLIGPFCTRFEPVS